MFNIVYWDETIANIYFSYGIEIAFGITVTTRDSSKHLEIKKGKNFFCSRSVFDISLLGWHIVYQQDWI